MISIPQIIKNEAKKILKIGIKNESSIEITNSTLIWNLSFQTKWWNLSHQKFILVNRFA